MEAYDIGKTDRDLNREGSTWEYWKPWFKQGAYIPVFFLEEKGEVQHFGLSMLYKMPYRYKVKDLVARLNQELIESEKPDLAECIFGYITDDKPISKGRVAIGHAMEVNNPEPMEAIEKVLGTPKASFYPYYLRQKVEKDGILKGNYRTYNNDEVNLKGRKRYPIHTRYKDTLGNPTSKNKNIATKFIPLPGVDSKTGLSGSVFNATVRFHNLLPEELGALLSAITFHNQNDKCFHTIGMGLSLIHI